MKDAVRAEEFYRDIKLMYTPPLLDMGQADWVAPIDLGHFAAVEVYGLQPAKDEEAEVKILPGQLASVERCTTESIMSLTTGVLLICWQAR